MSVTSEPRTRRGLSGPALVAAAFLLSTVVAVCFQPADIVFTDRDPHRDEGPLASIAGISVMGVAGVVVALAVALPLRRRPGRSGAGAIALAVLALLALPVLWWSGAPATLGAAAAWLAGLSRDARPLPGAARVAGIAGLIVAAVVAAAAFAGGVVGLAGG